MSGHSLKRQVELSEAYIKANEGIGLTLDTSLDMKDLGVRAFNGNNIDDGRLGEFIKEIDEGRVTKGSYLLIESFDRLSRLPVTQALQLFLSIINKGIVIVTLIDNKKYNEETLDHMDLLVSITMMARAHEESATKAKRVTAAWSQKRNIIHKQKLTKWSPKWLTLSLDRTEFIVNEQHAAVVKQIFEWSVSGLGTSLIIQKLENSGIEPFGWAEIKRTKRIADKWNSGIIQRFFSDRTVLGEYKLRKNNADEGFEIIQGYYPQIINEELFYRAQESRKSRNVRNRGGGRKGNSVSNLFSKLAKCGYSLNTNMGEYSCAGNNEVMNYINKGKKSLIKYLQCSRVRNGNTGCDECKKMWRYDHFEISFLTHLKDIDASVITGAVNKLEQEIELLEGKISIVKGQLAHNIENTNRINDVLNTSLDEGNEIPQFIIAKGNALDKEKIEIKNEIDLLVSELKNKEYEFEHSDKNIVQLSNLIDRMKVTDGQELFDLRLGLSELLKRVISRVEVYSKGLISDDSKIEKSREMFGDEAAQIMQENIEQSKKLVLPFYVVVYKSGEKRIIITNPQDPTDLKSSIKWDEDQILEKTQEWGVTPRSDYYKKSGG